MSKLTYIKSRKEFAKGNSKLNESVYKSGDNLYKVKVTIDVPKSLVNAVIKKVKDTKGPDILDMYSQTDIAEAIVKYVNETFLNIESIPGTILTGEEEGEEALAASEEPAINANPGGETPILDTPIDTPITGEEESSEEMPRITIESKKK